MSVGVRLGVLGAWVVAALLSRSPAVAGAPGGPDDVLAGLRPDHPRLIASADGFVAGR